MCFGKMDRRCAATAPCRARLLSSAPIWLLVLLLLSLRAAELAPTRKPNLPKVAAASDEAQLALSRFKAPAGFKVELFAAEPLLAHPVAFAIDEQNRFYIAESFRVGDQVQDIRNHMNWLDEELASTNTAQWRTIIEKYFRHQLDYMRAEEERVRLVEDTNGDGQADKATVFAAGFNDIQTGIAAGVLARKGDVWFACIPELWRLRDTNQDGRADLRVALHQGYGVRFGFYGHDLHGLRIGPDGKLYFSIGDRGFNILTPDGRRVASPESGAVLRCQLDGSDLEIFASGLRNPQELAFDEFGNLFTGDNNSDGGDQARWVYLVEGGDSGWRIGWQFLNRPVSRGPWNAEKMWHPQNDEQPAFLIPPLANFGNGPSGLTYDPGTGLPGSLAGHFFLADFKGTANQSLVHSFALKPKGASFEVVDRRPFLTGMLPTDVEFGMDGALYVADWVEGWGKTGKGRLYRVYHPEFRSDPIVTRTAELMRSGFAARNDQELGSLLRWPDQRVRQEAQFELAGRGAASIGVFARIAREETNPLARLHAIWGLGQIQANHHPPGEPSAAVQPLLSLLTDRDPEVRAQSAAMLGNARTRAAQSTLAKLVVDPGYPRVQFFAALALGKLADRASLAPILAMVRENADRDPYLRHAAVVALANLGEAALDEARRSNVPAVRLAVLLALRRLHSPTIGQFLRDPDPRLVLEAARAIYDLPITEALPALAALMDQPLRSVPLLRRVINADFRLGTPGAAAALARLAANASGPEGIRLEALDLFADWEKPPGRDRVTGLWRPMGERGRQGVVEALGGILRGLLMDASADVQTRAAGLAGQYRIEDAAGSLVPLAGSEDSAGSPRVAALQALAELNDPRIDELVLQAASSRHDLVRKEALVLRLKRNPQGGPEILARQLTSGTTRERQAALLGLGTIPDPGAVSILEGWLDQLVSGKVDPALELELLQAAEARGVPSMREKLARFERARPSSEIGKYLECLNGGNAAEGRKIFFEKPEASCVRCHKIDNEGGDAGPELDKAQTPRTREYILESIVAPNKTIAPGFETVIVRVKDGTVAAGVVKSETTTELTLQSPEEGPLTIARSQIETRARGVSGMPEGLGEILSKRDLRDLVEFLATVGTSK